MANQHKIHGAKAKRIRHTEAVERNIARAKRTNEQQLALIEQRPGNSIKERKKLEQS